MFVFWWIFKDIVENQDLYRERQTTFEKICNKIFLLFDLKDFIVYKHICKMYILADISGNYRK